MMILSLCLCVVLEIIFADYLKHNAARKEQRKRLEQEKNKAIEYEKQKIKTMLKYGRNKYGQKI